jgi:hypothetical protein
MVEFADFNRTPTETPMTDSSVPLIELLQKQGDDDFLRAVAEAVLQLLMEHDVEGLVGAGRYERGDGRLTWRNGYRDRELETRLGTLNLRVPKLSIGLQSGPPIGAQSGPLSGRRVSRAQARVLKRHLSLPVSTMSQWWVSRSRSAVVILAPPKTLGHSPKARLVVTMTEVRS